MIRRYKVTVVLSMIAALCLAGCATHPPETGLTVQMSQPVYYRSPNGDDFAARYGSLSDDSLHFVKVQMPDGREYTLPQVVSASGVRYTDERELLWWTHQGTVMVEIRNAEGNWEMKYSELREVRRKN
jgi:membrane-bound inhibitor of C-type lysozyme